MGTKTTAEKMYIKPGATVAAINVPGGDYAAMMGSLPDGVTISTTADGPCDVVHLFVSSKAELDALAPDAIAVAQAGGLLWISYPKTSSGMDTDITRDHGWEVIAEHGLRGVRQVSVNETWSALNFRPRPEE